MEERVDKEQMPKTPASEYNSDSLVL
jgi:hypothetical protein